MKLNAFRIYILIMCLLISSVLIYYNQPEKYIDIKNNVGVLTKIGCLKTLDTPEVFEQHQEFTQTFVGYKLVRCS